MRAMQSDQINELAEALASAQASILPAVKDRQAEVTPVDPKKRPYSYTYADLARVYEVSRKPLSDAKLSVTQPIVWDETGIYLRSVLMHASGQWIASELPLTADFTRPQNIGSMVMYYRRYCYAALVGIATEDDDGHAAQTAVDTRRARDPVNGPVPEDRRRVALVTPRQPHADRYVKGEAKAEIRAEEKANYRAPEPALGKSPFQKYAEDLLTEANDNWKNTLQIDFGVEKPSLLLNINQLYRHLSKEGVRCGQWANLDGFMQDGRPGYPDFKKIGQALSYWYDHEPATVMDLAISHIEKLTKSKTEEMSAVGETAQGPE